MRNLPRNFIIVSFVLALIIVVAGMSVVRELTGGVQGTLEMTVTKVYANQTAESFARATQKAIEFEQTETAEYQIYISKQTQAEIDRIMTATAINTPSPFIDHICEARVSNNHSYGLPDPGNNPNEAEHYAVEKGKTLQVRAKIKGMPSWYFVQDGNDKFFIKSENIAFLDPLCNLGLAEVDIHYAANYLTDDYWRLVLEDAFVVEEGDWKVTTRKGSINTEPDGDDRVLLVKSIGENTELYKDSLDERDFRAFEMNFNVQTTLPNINGYIGVKFFINDDGFYELRFSPYHCDYTLFNRESEIYDGEIWTNLCRDNDDFQVKLRVDEEGLLTIKINGVENSLIKIESIDNRQIIGKVHFVFNDLDAKIKYIVITAPEE